MNAELRALVVDDEPIARQILTAYIARTPDIITVGECSNALDAFAQLPRAGANLLFLDINMPEISGLQFARALPTPLAVVFITAYAEHAVESYDLNAVDYLLKPVSYERFCRAVEKARGVVFPVQPTQMAAPLESLLLKTDGRLVQIDIAKIFYIEALRDYVRYHTADGPIVVHATMKATEEKLVAIAGLVRVHKSYIVNLRYMQEISNGSLTVKSQVIPIGATYRDTLERALAVLQRR